MIADELELYESQVLVECHHLTQLYYGERVNMLGLAITFLLDWHCNIPQIGAPCFIDCN